jgi:hypothetical protein
MMTSSSKTKGILKKKSTLLNKDPPEGKTTIIAAVMRGRLTAAKAVTSTTSKN